MNDRYNVNPESPVRKICDKFEATVLKKWEENASALLACGNYKKLFVFTSNYTLFCFA